MRRIITVQDVRALGPCTDPREYVSEGWAGTFTDLLSLERVPPQDRIWVAVQLLNDKTNRLFAVWCARQTFLLSHEVDPRSIEACDVAERFANGEATSEELSVVRSAAESAAWSAAWSAVDSAAWSAAESAAWSAAWSVGESAVDSAVRSAVRSAAESVTRPAQIEKLKEMTKDM
jgi:hypothetical protein